MTDITPTTTTVSEEEQEWARRKELLKKRDSKGRKDKGYIMFEEEDSEEENLVLVDDVRSPSKMKKHSKPSFKFAKKEKSYFNKKDKEDKKDKDIKKEEKKKEEKEAKKEKSKLKRKSKFDVDETDSSGPPIFGVPLSVAVDRSKCHDGVPLPAIVRECIDYVEEFGLSSEGIYRISGVKSKVQALKDCYNRGIPGYLSEHEPSVVASLLKLYLRELPEPVLTKNLMLKFEEASTLKNVKQIVEAFQMLIEELPPANKYLLSWMIVHMTHVISREKQNKMSLQNVSIVLSPTMQISHRVLNVLFTYSKILFRDVIIKRYVPPLRPVTSRWSLELPDSPTSLEEELKKQESLLNKLHEQLMTVKDEEKEEQLWEVQRVVTQLKRKLKLAKKAQQSLKVDKQQDIPKEKKSPKQVEPQTQKMKSQQPQTQQQPQIQLPQPATQMIQPPQQPQHKRQVAAGFRRQILLPLVPQKVQPAQAVTAKPEEEDQKEEKTKEVIIRSVEELDEQLKEVELESKEQHSVDQKGEKPVASSVIPADYVENKDSAIVQSEVEGQEDAEVKIRSDTEEKPVAVEEKANVDDNKTGQVDTADIENNICADEALPEIDSKQTVSATEQDIVKETETEQANIEEEIEEDDDNTMEEVLDRIDDDREDTATPVEEEDEEGEEVDDQELEQLQHRQAELLLEEEELLAIGDELRKKKETELREIERLHQEIADLRNIRDGLYNSSSDDSSEESEEEEELEEILTRLRRENGQLERENQELCDKIHQERQICLEVKVQIRMIQQGLVDSGGGVEGSGEKEAILVQL